jgi:DNA repair exonuclease SbcCD nuclease subunit
LRLVHLSDLHLGFRQYQRLTPGGVNQREADVAATFRNAIDKVIELAPDVVIVAGDIFHSVRPTNQAILHAFLQFSRLSRALPDAIIVLVAGNHDTPRSTETGGILPLLAQLGLHVVDRKAERLAFPDRELSILAVPDVPGLVQPSLTPDAAARYNVLAIHGEVAGVLPAWVSAADRAAVTVPREELGARWDYIALGHYHVYTEVAPNAYYSGSIEYTSVNTWGETHEQDKADVPGKGFVERNLATGEHIFHVLDPVRPLIDFEPVRARGLTAAELDAKIKDAVESCDGGIDDKVVRLVVFDVSRHIARDLDHKTIRDYKRRALHFHLDLRRPDVFRIHAGGAPGGPRVDLKDVVSEKLRWRTIDADIDRTQLIERAVSYLDEANAVSLTPAAMVDAS